MRSSSQILSQILQRVHNVTPMGNASAKGRPGAGTKHGEASSATATGAASALGQTGSVAGARAPRRPDGASDNAAGAAPDGALEARESEKDKNKRDARYDTAEVSRARGTVALTCTCGGLTRWFHTQGKWVLDEARRARKLVDFYHVEVRRIGVAEGIAGCSVSASLLERHGMSSWSYRR